MSSAASLQLRDVSVTTARSDIVSSIFSIAARYLPMALLSGQPAAMISVDAEYFGALIAMLASVLRRFMMLAMTKWRRRRRTGRVVMPISHSQL